MRASGGASRAKTYASLRVTIFVPGSTQCKAKVR